LGTELSAGEIECVFKRLKFSVKTVGADELVIVPPSYRVDLEREIDFIEEVARIYGYDNIPTPISVTKVMNHDQNPVTKIETLARDAFTSFGFYEILNCNLISRKSLDKISQSALYDSKGVLEVMNPVSMEHSVVRPTLIPGILETIQRNVNRNQEDLRLFELGHAHIKADWEFPIELLLLTYALSGKRHSESWNLKPAPVDFYDVKGAVEELLEVVGIEDPTFKPTENELFVSGCTAEVLLEGERMGIIGEVHPQVLKEFDIDLQVFLGELDMAQIPEKTGNMRDFEPIPVFPSTTRDIAIILDNFVTFDTIKDVIMGLKVPILERIELFDVYSGEQIGKGKRSMAFSLQFRSRERTLRDTEVNRYFERIKKELIAKIDCTVREG